MERAAGSIARTAAGRAGRTGTGRHPTMEEGARGATIGARQPALLSCRVNTVVA